MIGGARPCLAHRVRRDEASLWDRECRRRDDAVDGVGGFCPVGVEPIRDVVCSGVGRDRPTSQAEGDVRGLGLADGLEESGPRVGADWCSPCLRRSRLAFGNRLELRSVEELALEGAHDHHEVALGVEVYVVLVLDGPPGVSPEEAEDHDEDAEDEPTVARFEGVDIVEHPLDRLFR